ncbi:MAG: aminoacyl-tRNA hydrolase [Fusobacteriia bacterium 4572_132]|nr:MAG: aminoacyl-tRNA hydrolase [Fusobacteriia bacterium 4572_132]
MKLIVGLGNPGKKYENTRHNIGFEVIKRFSKRLGFEVIKEKFQGEIIVGRYKEEKVLLLMPQTFMNLSGNSIIEVINFYKISIDDIVVIYDDMDLPLGKMRIRLKGSAGGHNGIKSIISHIGEEFIRIKSGIGKAREGQDTINFVLGRFEKEENEEVNTMIDKITEVLFEILENKKIEKIMNKYN